VLRRDAVDLGLGVEQLVSYIIGARADRGVLVLLFVQDEDAGSEFLVYPRG
jgi:hypothetical protein